MFLVVARLLSDVMRLLLSSAPIVSVVNKTYQLPHRPGERVKDPDECASQTDAPQRNLKHSLRAGPSPGGTVFVLYFSYIFQLHGKVQGASGM